MINTRRIPSLPHLVLVLTTIWAALSLAGCSRSSGPGATLGAGASGEEAGPAEPNPGLSQGRITAAWANDGGDKVTQDELRASGIGRGGTTNGVWDGSTIHLFGARNEVVNFNLVLEAAWKKASRVRVVFDDLQGPRGGVIRSVAPADADGVFDWTSRDIENFYVRYLQIRGLSLLSYENYDERHVPSRLRRPWAPDGSASGGWTDRPDHDKYYPEIAVPLELVPTFDIAGGHNQSIWTDIYIPKEVPSGIYQGAVKVYEGTRLTQFLPVQLSVKDFALPDTPSAATMVYLGGGDVHDRYLSQTWPNPGTQEADKERLVRDRHFALAHRHKISLIDSEAGATALGKHDQPSPEWLPRLSGELFTAAHGYAGPGVGVGNGVYSIGTYGSWDWKSGTEADMWKHADAWETWFEDNQPDTERFLYLIDESSNYAQIERWARWMASNPGPGRALRSLATIDLPTALAQTPDLGIAVSLFNVGDQDTWTSQVKSQLEDTGKRYFQYNGKRPSQGSFATEDDGVALRELAWAQYKMGVQRWMFWESTYYNDNQGGRGPTDVFRTAATFSGALSRDQSLGETGWNHSNGDGVLFYPGTDRLFPAESYGLLGPIASLRLKHWRRGIQDVDYLTMARAVDPQAVQDLVARMVPKAMWEYGIDNPHDPTYVHSDISWSTDPDVWEAARARLAEIILSGR